MIERAIRWLILVTAMMALPHQGILAAEALPQALAQIGDHRFYHGPHVRRVGLSFDGCRAASSSHGQVIIVWDATSGERLHELNTPDGPIWCLAFSPDGRRLAAGYGRHPFRPVGVAVFEVESGKLLRQLEHFRSDVDYLQFSADGEQLCVGEANGPVSIWAPSNGKQLRLWKPPSNVSSKGNKVEEFAIRGTLSPDGAVLVWRIGPFRAKGASSNTEVLRVHDAATDKMLYQKEFTLRSLGGLGALAFSANSKRCAAGCADKLVVWKTATGKELASLDVPNMSCFTLAPDGQQAVIEAFGVPFRLWNLQTGKPARDLIFGLDAQFAFSSDGQILLVASANSALRLFDTKSGEERVMSGHRTPVTPRFSGDGRTLFTACREWRYRWDVSRLDNPVRLAHERRRVWGASWLDRSSDDQLFLDNTEPGVRVRETATNRIRCRLEAGVLFVVSGKFSPDSTQVLLGEFRDKHSSRFPDLYRLCNAKTGKTVAEIKPVMQASYPVFSPDGQLIAWADEGGCVHLHETTTGKAIRTLRSARPFPETVSYNIYFLFSPDSQYLIAGQSISPMRVFQVSSGREIACFHTNPKEANRAVMLSCWACSPNGRLLAVAETDSGIIHLLEIASGKVRADLSGHRHGVHGLDFAPDGETLASGGEDNVVFLWDVTGARTPSANPLRQSDFPSLWDDLASEDGQRAGAAIASLLRKSEASVAFLQERLHPAAALNEKRLAQWIGDLDADFFETRQAASKELAQLGERAEPALRRALRSRPSLEAKRRLEELRNKLELHPPSLETLRALRAIEVLERLGTPAARRCLEAQAKGASDARQTRDAQAALQRLAKHRK